MNLWKISTLVLAVLLLVVVGASGRLTVGDAQAEKQPLMMKALDNLKDARRNLENATHDKGGHRKKALELTDQAIEEVRKGIAFDNAK